MVIFEIYPKRIAEWSYKLTISARARKMSKNLIWEGRIYNL